MKKPVCTGIGLLLAALSLPAPAGGITPVVGGWHAGVGITDTGGEGHGRRLYAGTEIASAAPAAAVTFELGRSRSDHQGEAGQRWTQRDASVLVELTALPFVDFFARTGRQWGERDGRTDGFGLKSAVFPWVNLRLERSGGPVFRESMIAIEVTLP